MYGRPSALLSRSIVDLSAVCLSLPSSVVFWRAEQLKDHNDVCMLKLEFIAVLERNFVDIVFFVVALITFTGSSDQFSFIL